MINDATVFTGVTTPEFSAWWYLKQHHTLPDKGGWLSQPLSLLASIEAIDLVYDTWQFIREKESDWSKLNATQRLIVKEFSNG